MTTPSPRDCLLFALLSLLAACGAGGELEEDHQAATQGAEALWPGYIPYQADCSAGSFDPYSFCEPTVRDGVAEWNRRVGFLPLIPRTTETNYVAFRPSLTAGEAYSYVGMQGGLQILTVPDTGRLSTSVIGFLHEVGHAAGLVHEQGRSDRDWFVELNAPNINDARQFSKAFTAADRGWYDFKSIMHYRSEDLVLFAKDKSSWVMRTRAPSMSWPSATGLTEGDVSGLRAMYFGDWSGDRYDLKVSLAARNPAWGNSVRQNAFAPKRSAYPWSCLPGEVCLTADLDANGADDIVVFNHGRDGYNTVYTQLSDGSGFSVPVTAHSYFCTASELCALGDVNGDGRADLITFQHGTPGTAVYVALGDSGRPGMFLGSIVAASSFCGSNADCKVADVDGNGTDDLVSIDYTSGALSVVLTHASGGLSFDPPFEAPAPWLSLRVPSAASLGQLHLADVNGDRRADAVWFARADGRVYVALSAPGASFGRWGYTLPGFGRWNLVHGWFCVGSEECRLADVDGDGKRDLVTFDRAGGRSWVSINASTTSALSFGGGLLWSEEACATGTGNCELGDFNGDGADDVIEFVR